MLQQYTSSLPLMTNGQGDARVSMAQHDKACLHTLHLHSFALEYRLSAKVCPDMCCRCQLKKNLEECIVGMSSSSITLNNCCLRSSEGVAIDMTGTSVLRMSYGSVQDCVGKTSKQIYSTSLKTQVRVTIVAGDCSHDVCLRWSMVVGAEQL
jgi:hypothetical protein